MKKSFEEHYLTQCQFWWTACFSEAPFDFWPTGPHVLRGAAPTGLHTLLGAPHLFSTRACTCELATDLCMHCACICALERLSSREKDWRSLVP